MPHLLNSEQFRRVGGLPPFSLSDHAQWQPQPKKIQGYTVSASGPSLVLPELLNGNVIWQQVDSSTSLASLHQLRLLEQIYIFRGPEEVSRFLCAYQFLIPLLLEARTKIAEHFEPYPPVFLEVMVDPDAIDDHQLVAFIQANLEPAEALASLDRFDKDWWLEASRRSRGKLCIHLEYR